MEQYFSGEATECVSFCVVCIHLLTYLTLVSHFCHFCKCSIPWSDSSSGYILFAYVWQKNKHFPLSQYKHYAIWISVVSQVKNPRILCCDRSLRLFFLKWMSLSLQHCDTNRSWNAVNINSQFEQQTGKNNNVPQYRNAKHTKWHVQCIHTEL